MQKACKIIFQLAFKCEIIITEKQEFDLSHAVGISLFKIDSAGGILYSQ